MGMAASQARLLTITARMHDVEYAAQAIQNAKIQLATQSDQVYQNYLEALDATTLTVTDWDGNKVAANFANLCGINRIDSQYAYSLYDEKGRLIVPDDIYQGYMKFQKSSLYGDPYIFAMYMLDEDNVEQIKDFYNDDSNLEDFIQKLPEGPYTIYQENMDSILNDPNNYKNQKVESFNDLKEEKANEYRELEEKRNYQIYKTYAEELYTEMKGVDFDQDEFNYYATFYKQIQQAGGCVSISEFNGISGVGDASSDGDWLKKMIQSGKITLDTWIVDNKSGELTLSSTGVSSDSCLAYTTTSTIDKSALAKAEAEYEFQTKQIDKKDKQYDMELSKLETERTALDKQYESVKKIASENIERTFGIFS